MPYDPSSDDIERIIQEATSFKNILVGAYDASKHPAQIVIIRKLMSKNLIVAAIRSPYDIMSFNDIPCYLISYGFTPFSMEALRDVLWGSYRPVGQLPIAIPGVK